MHFEWSPEQQHLFERTLAFAQTRLSEPSAPTSGQLDGKSESDDSKHLSRSTWESMGRFGLLSIVTPKAYGGMGLDALTTARVVEALGQGCHDLGIIFAASAHLFACVSPIVEYGSDELKLRFLPKMSNGDWIGANAITEAEAGSDIASLKTLATRDGEHYVLDGTKTYVSNGPRADVFLVYATQNPAHGYLGISAFIVERDTKGITLGQPLETGGLQTATICPVYFENCRIPQANMLGTAGRGSAIFASSMLAERSCLFGMYLGAMQNHLDRAIAYATDNRLATRKNQALRHRIVNMKMRLESARYLLYRACWERDRGHRATLAVAMGKLAVSEAAIENCVDGFELFGHSAPILQRFHRDLYNALPGAIFSGTSEIQRELIARELGL